MQLNNLKERISDLEHEYKIDKTELGEVMAVTCLALLMISAHAAISLQDSISELEQTNNDLDELRGIMNSQSFESSMEALETTAVEISQDFERVYQGFSTMESDLERVKTVEENLKQRYEFYRWIILISLIGIVTGISLIYI